MYIVRTGRLILIGPSIGRELDVNITIERNPLNIVLNEPQIIHINQPLEIPVHIQIRERDSRPEYDDFGQNMHPLVIPCEPGVHSSFAYVDVHTQGGDQFAMTTFAQEFIIKVWNPGQAEPEDPDPVPTPKQKPPLVFVPGIMACELETADGKQMWPPRVLDDRDEDDNPNATLANFLAELEEIASGIGKRALKTNGKFAHVLGHKSYDNLLNRLKEIGYEKGKNLLVFYYDWTRSNEDNGKKLTKAVIKFLKKFPDHDKAKAICHSMGGLVTRAAMKFNDAPIDPDQTVYIGTPHLGAPIAYFTAHPGIKRPDLYTGTGPGGFSYETLIFLNSILNIAYRFGEMEFLSLNRAFSKISYYITSNYELFPDENYLKKSNILYFVDPDYPKSSRKHRVKVGGGSEGVYLSGETRLGWKYKSKVRKAMDFKKRLGRIPGKPLCIFGSKKDTPRWVNYWAEFDDGNDGNMGSQYPHEFVMPHLMPSGDGTVPALSATGGYQAGPARYSINGGEHMKLADLDEAIDKAIEFLRLE